MTDGHVFSSGVVQSALTLWLLLSLLWTFHWSPRPVQSLLFFLLHSPLLYSPALLLSPLTYSTSLLSSTSVFSSLVSRPLISSWTSSPLPLPFRIRHPLLLKPLVRWFLTSPSLQRTGRQMFFPPQYSCCRGFGDRKLKENWFHEQSWEEILSSFPPGRWCLFLPNLYHTNLNTSPTAAGIFCSFCCQNDVNSDPWFQPWLLIMESQESETEMDLVNRLCLLFGFWCWSQIIVLVFQKRPVICLAMVHSCCGSKFLITVCPLLQIKPKPQSKVLTCIRMNCNNSLSFSCRSIFKSQCRICLIHWFSCNRRVAGVGTGPEVSWIVGLEMDGQWQPN